MSANPVLRNTKLSVKLIKSTIGRPEYQKKIVGLLGFRKLNQTRIHNDGPQVWGMLKKDLMVFRYERSRWDAARHAVANGLVTHVRASKMDTHVIAGVVTSDAEKVASYSLPTTLRSHATKLT